MDHAVEHGLIAHRFYASDGQIMVDRRVAGRGELPFVPCDTPKRQIGEMMVAAGVTGQPEPNFWRELETHDEYGWNA